MRSTPVPYDQDHPARRWFHRWSLWPPVLDLPPWIRWVQASPARRDHGIAGALITATAPLERWIWCTPNFPKYAISGVYLVPIGLDGQSALDRNTHDPQHRLFGTGSYGDLSDAVVTIGQLVRAGSVVVCEGLSYGLALACRRSEPVVITFGSARWSSEATAFALGRFKSVMLAPSVSRSGREAAGALCRKVQAYGADRRAPHVRSANDETAIIGSLPSADPVRLNEITQSYVNTGHSRWEAARLAYVRVTARPERS